MPHRAPHHKRNTEAGGIIFRFLFLVFLAALVFGIYLARHPLLRLAGSFWIVDETPETSDAIVILGDDNYDGDRANRAAELFKSGVAPRVIASGRYLRPFASVAELEEHDLTNRGVPTAAVIRLTHRATDTREEAAAIGQLLSSRGWKRVILVTSNYHTRRSRYICERLFPAGTVLRVVAARDSEYNAEQWWLSRQGIKIFVHEFVGLLEAMWELRHYSVQTSEPGVFDLFRKSAANLRPGFAPLGFWEVMAIL